MWVCQHCATYCPANTCANTCSTVQVTTHPRSAWCPRPGCGRSVQLQLQLRVPSGAAAGAGSGGNAAPAHAPTDPERLACAVASGRGALVTCGCGTAFCFCCGRTPAHEPASCAQMDAWEALQAATRSDAEAGSSAWVAGHTRPCPKCGARIQKVRGMPRGGRAWHPDGTRRPVWIQTPSSDTLSRSMLIVQHKDLAVQTSVWWQQTLAWAQLNAPACPTSASATAGPEPPTSLPASHPPPLTATATATRAYIFLLHLYGSSVFVVPCHVPQVEHTPLVPTAH